MFFYLSFLRPLPRSSSATSAVSITPQIANDLRTCHLEDTIDIFYSWSPSLWASPGASSMTRKLTTWRSSSMYKNITIPLPPNAKAGQEWWLSLSCTSSWPNFAIDLCAKDFGTQPFPVISMPISIDAVRGKNIYSATKQEHIERLYTISTVRGKSTRLCIREQTSFELDKKIWDSGVALSSWLSNLMLSSNPASNPSIQQVKTLLNPSQPAALNIMELGTGTGIVSICLSTLLENLHRSRSQHIQVFATDLPSAIELIEHNVFTNKSMYSSIDLQSLVLDWDGVTLPPQVLGEIDLIIMADVTYNSASFPSLVSTLGRLIRSSRLAAGRPPCILLAYKQRDPSERNLWPMLQDIGIDMTLVDQVRGVGSEEVEVWIWSETKNEGDPVP